MYPISPFVCIQKKHGAKKSVGIKTATKTANKCKEALRKYECVYEVCSFQTCWRCHPNIGIEQAISVQHPCCHTHQKML